ncbi:hypothetical protein G7Z17_g3224 [Cylindrodendrum hubeiense]|uniref:Rhodopsin domain-containing protein n=1 Tax=Cylindrodendrum hubeiense TaxID=595255 RepID=A0A9P5HCW3_9HYPO|nr:hypothetical protein G7Z17_g3224 [Cylindrodendrum hubeiense]
MATPFQTEAWTEYGIGSLVLLLRFFARWKTVGLKNWQGDDIFAMLSLAELVMLELIGQNGTNIGVTNEIGATLTDEEIAKREFGSKCLLAGWNFYVTLIWCLKGTMLCFYNRMTLGLKQQKIVKWTQLVSVLAYIGVIAVIWGHCTPVHKNWQVTPYPGVANYITLVVLNISTDLVIVCIPVPILWKVKLNLKRKLIVGVLLDISGINTSTIWAIRETFVGIIAVNAAAIKPLFSASRWIGSSKGSSDRYKSSGYGSNKYGHPLGTIGGSGAHPSANSSNRHRKMMTDLGENSSEEHIVQKADFAKKPDYNGYQNDIRAESTNSDGASHQNGIMVTREYEVSPAKSTLDV